MANRKMSVSAASRIVQRDLVRRLLPPRPFDQRDHAVEEGLAGIARHLYHDPVREHPRAAGHRAAITAGLADHRRALAGDRALVDRGDAGENLAIGGDEVAGLDQHHVALAQTPGLTSSKAASSAGRRDAWRVVSVRVRRSASACALPRPSAIASAKLAKSTVNQSQREIARMKPAGASPWPNTAWIHKPVVSTLTDLDDEHHRILELHPRRRAC